jgi:hypothetical protein
MSLPDQTIRSTLNSGSADSAQINTILKLCRFGDFMAGVRDVEIENDGTAYLNLAAFTLPDGRALPGARPGGHILVTDGGAENLEGYVIGGTVSLSTALTPGASITVTGAANGNLIFTGKATDNPAPFRFAIIENVGVATAALTIMDMVDNGAAEIWVQLDVAASTRTTTANAFKAAWDADPVASKYADVAVSGTGLGIVGTRVDPAKVPTLSYQDAAGPPVVGSPGVCLASLDGTMLMFADTVTLATLNYTPAAPVYAESLFPQPSMR